LPFAGCGAGTASIAKAHRDARHGFLAQIAETAVDRGQIMVDPDHILFVTSEAVPTLPAESDVTTCSAPLCAACSRPR
jgi:hypothetical protein